MKTRTTVLAASDICGVECLASAVTPRWWGSVLEVFDQFAEDRDLRTRTTTDEWEQGRWWDRLGIVLAIVLLIVSVVIVVLGLILGWYER